MLTLFVEILYNGSNDLIVYQVGFGEGCPILIDFGLYTWIFKITSALRLFEFNEEVYVTP